VNPTRDALQRVATHVLARARFAATGRFGLRATPGGFGTPAFGEETEVLRVSGGLLVRERDGRAAVMPLDGATLAELAAFAGADSASIRNAGKDTPPIGDVKAPLAVDVDTAALLADWWQLGWRAMDAAIAGAADPISTTETYGAPMGGEISGPPAAIEQPPPPPPDEEEDDE